MHTATPTRPVLPFALDSIKGFLAEDEGEALYRHGLHCSGLGPLLEIGSYCGRSSVYLGLAARAAGTVVFAVDHHRGSEEHQPGELFHDPELYDAQLQAVDTLPALRRTLARAQLEDVVLPVVTRADVLSAHFPISLGLLFIDGGHSLDSALEDYRGWAHRVARGGVLAIHDVYPDAALGGQAPITVHRLALASGLFTEIERVQSLRLLRRL
jgi:predicted O-methyltransferase YrrM